MDKRYWGEKDGRMSRRLAPGLPVGKGGRLCVPRAKGRRKAKETHADVNGRWARLRSKGIHRRGYNTLVGRHSSFQKDHGRNPSFEESHQGQGIACIP